jgi:glycogen operon protein
MSTLRSRRTRIVALAAICTALTVGGTALVDPTPVTASVDAGALGARYDATGTTLTFRVRSAAATRIVADLFDTPTGAGEKTRLVLTRDASGTFSASVAVTAVRAAGIAGTVYYGYRAWGPNWAYDPAWAPGSAAGFRADVDSAGNRFNPNKLLLDPYAREVSHDPLRPGMTDLAVYASGAANRTRDTGPVAPKGIVLPATAPAAGVKPARALKDDIVYEVNLRGLTMNDPSVSAADRGTYRGAAAKAGYLSSLGVTAVEFLPVQEFQNDTNDVDATGTTGDNYWGYMPLNWFAPDRRYAADRSPGGPTREFQQMVKAFHDAGIKVLLDVVYNHTGEDGVRTVGGEQVYNVLSYRGLDNPTYYSLSADRQTNVDNTGVGGNYNTYNPVAQDLIVDSLAYWKDTLGVDGFRHDLAPVLGNTCQHGCFRYSRDDPGTALNRLVREMPARPATGGAGVDWIAEPWALGDGTYQVGNFPAGWSEWNGQYRDTVRRDQNELGSAAVTPGTLATRFAGSSDLYGDDGRRPFNSVNFLVAHDGFTLHDLYACNTKNNGQPWPYGPSDGGSDQNDSWDQGGIAADQRRAARTGYGLLMLSAGTPMLTGGDETLRDLRCNNNPYNLDSSANWLGWSPTAEQATFRTFAARLAAFRRAHPALRPVDFYSGGDGNGNGLAQLAWFTPAGVAPDAAYWSDPGNHALAWRIDGTEFADPAPAVYVAYNGWSGDVDFVLPPPGAGRQWYRVTDTSTWAEGPDQVASPGAEALIGGQGTGYRLRGRGLLLLVAR